MRRNFYDAILGPTGENPFPVVPAENFVFTLAANVDNEKLTDAEFREFVRGTLPIVIYPRREKDNEKR